MLNAGVFELEVLFLLRPAGADLVPTVTVLVLVLELEAGGSVWSGANSQT